MRRIPFVFFTLALVVVLSLGGCMTRSSPYNSSDTPTSNIYASFEVSNDSNNEIWADTEMMYKNSFGNDIQITGGENIACNGTTLYPYFENQVYHYKAKVTPASQYLFRFTRGDNQTIDTIAPQLPKAVPYILGVSDLTQGQNLTITWQSAPESDVSFEITITSPVFSMIELTVPDNGSYTVNASQFKMGTAEPGYYAMQVKLTRYRTNSVNRAYSGGGCVSKLTYTSQVHFTKTS